MRPPVQDRSRESTERVLETALRILEDDGPTGLTTARVAREAGVSNGTIYHRFGNRRALVMGAYALFNDEMRARADGMRGRLGPPDDLAHAIARVVATYRLIFSTHAALVRAFFVEAVQDVDVSSRGTQESTVFVDQVAAYLTPFLDEVTAPDPGVAFDTVHRILFGHFIVRAVFHDGDPGSEETLRGLRRAVRGVLQPDSWGSR